MAIGPLEAHYSAITAAEKRANLGMVAKITFAVTTDGNREWHATPQYCRGKSDAREYCREYGATPWNF